MTRAGDRLAPPDRAERVRAASALVLAPHPDDELLGCGGLLLQLLAGGAAVRILYLTDGAVELGGSGGKPRPPVRGGAAGGSGEEAVPQADRRAEYARRRRAEADAVCRRLGVAGCEHLGLPDGGLADSLDAVSAALRRALLSQRPELLLVPAPTEASRDHRAAFGAVHRLLGGLRKGDGDPLSELAPRLAVLAYEINRPAYPDLLVDVSAEVGELRSLMELYASQGERRGYWRASLGLRRYRTLTLGSDVEGPDAAEGYRRLAAADFATASPAQLVARLGGTPEVHEVREGPKVSVVVRTRDRPGLLAEALASLAAGSYRRAEVILVNDGGAPPEVPGDFPLPVVRVDLAEGRGRAAAANAGVAAATGDHVAFLDDDDLAAPEHLATLAGLAAAPGVRVAYTDAAVAVYALAGPAEGGHETPAGWRCVERRLPYSRDFDPDRLLVDNYIPFNTVLVERSLFAELAADGGCGAGDGGPFDETLPFFEDWDLLIRLAGLTPFHHLARVTCEYRHFRGGGGQVFGEAPRRRADFLAVKARVIAKHAERLGPERLARIADGLRAEAVEAAEEAGAARREAERAWRDAADARQEAIDSALARVRLEGGYAELETRYHALRGELDARREDAAREQAELRRLYADETALRATVDERDAHLGRTYAEIARLEERIREMEGTRAWRVHRRLETLRGR